MNFLDTLTSSLGFSKKGDQSVVPPEQQPAPHFLDALQNTISSIPVPTIKKVEPIPQEQRTKMSIASLFEPLRGPARATQSLISNARGENVFVPETTAEKFLYGEQPIKSLGKIYEEQKSVAKGAGLKGAGATIAGAVGAGSESFLDLLGFAGEEGKLAKASKVIGATQDAEKIIQETKNLYPKMSEEIIQKNISALQKANPEEATTILKQMKQEHNIQVPPEVKDTHVSTAVNDYREGNITQTELASRLKDAHPDVNPALIDRVAEDAKVLKSEHSLEDGWVNKQIDNLPRIPQEKPISEMRATEISPSKLPTEATSNKKMDPFYNLDRLNIPEETKTVMRSEIESLKPEIEKVVGKPLSHKEVVQYADNTAQKLEETIGRDQTQELISANLNERRELARLMKGGKMTPEVLDALEKSKSYHTSVARQLEALKIVADPEASPLLKDFYNKMVELGKTRDEILEAFKNVDFNNAKQVAEVYRTVVKPRLSEWIDLIRYNSMLSGPRTHLVNLASNLTGGFVVKPLTVGATGVVDAIRSALGGGPREYFARETGAYLKGATKYEALQKARQNFADIMSGKVGILNTDIRNVPLATKGFKGMAAKVLNYPMKLLEGADKFVSAFIESGTEEQLKYRAKRMGQELTTKKIKEIQREAKFQSAKALFRNELVDKNNGPVLNFFGHAAQSIELMRNSPNPILRTVAKFTFPFIRTGTNIINTGLEYSPLTGWSTIIGSKKKTEQIAKVSLGVAASLGMAILAGSDRLTFKEPTDATERAAFRASGRRPYSVRIGDTWVSYQRLHPAIAFPLALTAAIDTAIKNKKMDETTADAILVGMAKYGNFITDQSFVKNIGDFVNSFQGDPEGITKLVANYPQQIIPFRALASWVERLTDPVQRKADTDGSILARQWQQIASQLPGLAQTVPTRKDVLGNPIPNKNRIINAISPVDVSRETPAQRKEFQFYQEAKIVKGQELKTEKKINKAIDSMVDSLKGHSLYEKKQILKSFIIQHKDVKGLSDKIIENLKSRTEPQLTQSERTIKSLGVEDGSRATFILKALKELPKSERQAYLKNLSDKKILTGDVISQINELRKQR